MAASPALKCNADGPWIVQKFGGTSVGKFLDVIGSEIVPSYINAGNRVAVVCSARSGDKKATGTTNLLLRAALEAITPTPSTSSSSASVPGTPAALDKLNPLTKSPIPNGVNGSKASGYSTPQSMSASISNLLRGPGGDDPSQQAFNTTVDQIKEEHLRAARGCIKDEAILAELEDDLDYDCERLRSFLLAAQIIDEISARSRDIIMGVGERLSCRIVTASLRDQGLDAELVSLENIVEAAATTEDAGGKREGTAQLGQAFYDRLAKRLGERLLECGDKVPVITGFFGVVPGSLLSQVGRGYTDLCAALCAVGLSASELQVWKEVDGIFTADPSKVLTSRLIPTITPEEAAELTYYGSEVIHPFTMEQVIRASIPIRIKNVKNVSGPGTIIFPDPPSDEDLSGSIVIEGPSPTARDLDIGGPTAVTINDNIIMLSIRSNRKTISHGFFARIFGTLDRFGIIVDLISTSEVYVSMAISGSIRAPVLERVAKELQQVGEVTVKRNMAILSLVGKKMKNMKGIAGLMFTTLAQKDINIEMISQGASEINISCVITKDVAVKALNVVHLKLLTKTPEKVGAWTS